MSNVHGLFSRKRDEDDDDDDDENNRYVGGIGDHGGGSGLAVRPNVDEGAARDALFNLAESATADDNNQVRRTITMYRDGFTVDDGPYRRLDDPANAPFLRSLAMGRTPAELAESADENVVVGLVDKRDTEYREEFRAFSGQGNTLRSPAAASNSGGTFNPDSLPETPPEVNPNQPTTSIQVRLPNGKRRVLRINLTATVADVAAHLRADAEQQPFRLVAGFPPKPLEDSNATIEQAGLKGAQVALQKA